MVPYRLADNDFGEGKIGFELGFIHLKQGKPPQAMKYYKKAYPVFNAKKDNPEAASYTAVLKINPDYAFIDHQQDSRGIFRGLV